MKLYNSMSVVICSFAFFFIASSAVSAPPENPNLTNFGYYHGDMNFNQSDGSGYVSDNLDAIGGWHNSNVVSFSVWPRYYSSHQDILHQHLQKAASYGMKVLLNVYGIFFDYNDSGSLMSDWQSAWNNYKNAIAGYEDKILGFYIDEPKQSGVTESDFHTVTQKIRQDYPDKKMMSVISYDTLMDNTVTSSYLQYCTDAGFDYYYGSWNWWDYWNDREHYYPYLFDKFKTEKAPTQNLWVIPKVFKGAIADDPNPPKDDIENWYDLAKGEQRTVGMLNFTYASYWDGNGNAIGAGQLFDETNANYDSELKATHISIGQEVIPEPATILIMLLAVVSLKIGKRDC